MDINADTAARITHDIARLLADLSHSLEENGYAAERTANFLMRCIFTMFAEDVKLIPANSFRDLLKLFTDETPADQRLNPDLFPGMVQDVWLAMDTGTVSSSSGANLQQFNGGLFADTEVPELNTNQIALLHSAACCEWREVEPAIFGTLLERALNPKERHKLDAPYPPRDYVERLLIPTVIEPLREDWQAVLAAAVLLDHQGKGKEAVETCREFLTQLSQTLVLDPACGTGNFLYVTMKHIKRLEGEVRDAMANFAGSNKADIPTEFQVGPHQFLGIEINPRAAAIAELVLWIGYFQWQIKAVGTNTSPESFLKNYHSIEPRDALLEYDHVEPLLNKAGQQITRWDGETLKPHPTTGELVADHKFRVPVWRYINPRKAPWPSAHFIIGKAPSLCSSRMRDAFGDSYTDTLRTIHPEVPEAADFEMYWWNRAAEILRGTDGRLRRFGFITTNSLLQTINRRVLQNHMKTGEISLAFAIPDHPWIESTDGAAVRVAMTVARPGQHPGILYVVADEAVQPGDRDAGGSGSTVRFDVRFDRIHPDFSAGAAVYAAQSLVSNLNISSPGVKLNGSGFVVSPFDLPKLGVGSVENLDRVLKPFLSGRDLTQTPRNVSVIDLYGLDIEVVQAQYPQIYEWVTQRVKPERDVKRRAASRGNWWTFGEPRPELRAAVADLPRYIATAETSKHRFFVFVDASILPDSTVVAIGLSDAYYLGVLSSRMHVAWALAAGGTLENRPHYDKSRCFETFPFPDATPEQAGRIREIAEALDAHRKRQQSLHPRLTLTMCYNVLKKVCAGDPLTNMERNIHNDGLVTVLRQLHGDLDAAVAEAYGWPANLAYDEILHRLLELNRKRVAEEVRGKIRYLRPEYQEAGPKA